MAIQNYYTQTAKFYSTTEPTPDSPASETLELTASCWVNNRGGSFGYSNDKLTHDYDCTLKMDVSSISETWDVVHTEQSARYKIVRINNPGYRNHHMTIYLQRKRDGSTSN